MFYFGDANTHAGKFVFQNAIEGDSKHTWAYRSTSTSPNLDGTITMSLSDLAKHCRLQ